MPISEALRNAKHFLHFTANVRNETRSHEYKKSEYRWLKHGYWEALLAHMYFSTYPSELEKDAPRYGSICLETVLLGVILHDALGKPAAVPDSRVWELPRQRLSMEDLLAMQRHHDVGWARSGYWFDSDPIPRLAQDIIHYHHEKLDGTGPEKLVGDEISHIVQSVTVIDQILSRCEPRSYHSHRFAIKSAVGEVRSKATSRFNVTVIENMTTLFEKNAHLEYRGLLWLGEY